MRPAGSTAAWFRPVLALVVLVGLAARLAFVSVVSFPGLANDAVTFRLSATNLARGKGYVATFPADPHHLVATAAHPPLFPALLAGFDLLGIESVAAQRLALAVTTSIAVLVMGLLGRKVGGPVVGVVAAAIAALHPLWLQPVGTIMSESVYLVVLPLMLLQALRCLEKPTPVRYLVLGIVVGAAVLTRSEAIDFIVLLGGPLLVFAAVPWKERGILAVALLIGLVVLVGPWLIRNEVQVGGAVLSDQQGVTLAGSYCSTTFDPTNAEFGSFDGACADGTVAVYLRYVRPPHGARQWTEIALDRTLTTSSEQFARHHLGALPGVVVAREASAWGLGDHQFQLALAVAGGRNRAYEQAGWIAFWVMVPFALAGGIVLARRSWRRLVIIVVPIAVVAANVAVTYGSTRLRIAAEPSLAVLAALGGVAIVQPILREPRTGQKVENAAPSPGALL